MRGYRSVNQITMGNGVLAAMMRQPVATTTSESDAMLLRALLDQGLLAVGVVDAQGRLVLMSRALRQLAGAPDHDIPASQFPEAFHLYNAAGTSLLRPEDVPVTRAASGQVVRDAVVSVRRPGEQVRYVRCDAVPLTTPDGDRAGAMVVASDVTAEQAATARQDTIRALLLDTVNHELRTPLTVVQASVELLIDGAEALPEHLHGPLAAIVRASGQLRDTIQHVSDLADLEAAGRATTARTNIHDLIATVAHSHQHRAQQRDISLSVVCAEDLSWELDSSLVRKALAALLDNALVYGPPNTEVSVTAQVADDLLQLRVTDQGSGIPDDDRQRLLQPFERGSTSLAAHHRRGLGLPTAQAVASSHHGALMFSAHKPHGFTARLLFPQQQA